MRMRERMLLMGIAAMMAGGGMKSSAEAKDRSVAEEAWKNASRYALTFDAPPKNVPTDLVPDGPLLGNGDLGVTQSGQPEEQRFWLSKCDFWKGKSAYGQGGPRSLGHLSIRIPALAGGSYHIEQSMAQAETRSEFRSGNAAVVMKSWVPATTNALVIELSVEGEAVPVELDYEMPDGGESTVERGVEKETRWFVRKFDGPGLDWPTEAAVALRLREGERFDLRPGHPVVLVAAIRSNHETTEYLEAARKWVDTLDSRRIAALRSAHRRWWRSFWSKSFVETGDPVIDLRWLASQYLMACCSRNEGFPPGLFGNWITTDSPAWSGDYHLNYNYQAPWWSVYSSNHVELSKPYDAPLLEFIPKGRENARKLLNCRGVYMEVGIGPRGVVTSLSDHYDRFWGQKSDAAYAAVDMVMRWHATLDKTYLKKDAYPFLREVGDFWEDYLKLEGGRYVIENDSIHEGSGDDMNPILSLGLVRMTFRNLLEMSEALGVDADRRAKWKDILDRLSAFPLQERDGKTVFRYSEKGTAWWNDNTLGVQHIWPAGEIGLDSDPKLLQVARNTIDAMGRWKDYNGFPTFFTAAARVGYDPATILSHLHEQCEAHGYPNGFIFYGGGGIECLSAVPSCVNEMMLQSRGGFLRLFPVWPKDRDARFGNLRADGAFLVSAAFRSGRTEEIVIKSEKGGECVSLNPWPERAPRVFEVRGEEEIPVAVAASGDRFSFQTRRNGVYRIR